MAVLRERLSRDALRLALKRNAPELAVNAFPWAEWARALERLVTPRIAETMRAAGEAVGRRTRIHKQETVSLQGVFDLTNPRAQRHAAQIAANLVTLVDMNTRQAIREVIADAQARGISLRDQADEIERILRETAGLDRVRARQLFRYERGLREQGLSDRIVRRRFDQRRDRLLMARAKTIARTETMDAANAGQVEVWRQAEEAGLLPPRVEREWITAPDDRTCPICDPMNGQRRLDGDRFVSDFSGQSFERPPAHPACRCTLALALD